MQHDTETVLEAYIECALWSSLHYTDPESDPTPMDDDFGPDDLAEPVEERNHATARLARRTGVHAHARQHRLRRDGRGFRLLTLIIATGIAAIDTAGTTSSIELSELSGGGLRLPIASS